MKEIHTVSIRATKENDQRFILSCILTYLFPIKNKSNKTNKYIKLLKQNVEGELMENENMITLLNSIIILGEFRLNSN